MSKSYRLTKHEMENNLPSKQMVKDMVGQMFRTKRITKKMIEQRRAKQFCCCAKCLQEAVGVLPKGWPTMEECQKKVLEMLRERKAPGAIGNLTGGKWG